MGFVIVLLLLIGGGAGAYFYFFKNGNTVAKPAIESTIPVKHTVPEAPNGTESVYHADDFIPQDTIYTYVNPTPGVNCPSCDAESPSGMQFCQVCGARLHGAKFT